MNNIKHYSFDLWLTLIKSNPTFKIERTLLFYKNFNTLNKTLTEVESVFRNIDLMCNAINEKTGKNIDSEEMYLMVIFQINNTLAPFESIDTAKLYKEIEQLIFKYTPVIYDIETYECLDKMKQNPTVTLSTLSNTAFIKGSTLRIILDHLELSKYFDFQIYSDEEGISKPNKEIYNSLLTKIYAVSKTKNISLNEIMHVGDNPIADILGAKSIGIHAYQINSNDKLISNLFN